VRDRQRDVVCDPACRGHVVRAEGVDLLGPEFDSQPLLARRRVDREERAIACRHDPLLKVGGIGNRQRFVREIVDDEHVRVVALIVTLGQLDPIDLHEVVVRGGLHHDHIRAVVERHGHQVVRQHLVGDFGYPREHRADVEHAGNRSKQFDRGLEVCRPVALDSRPPGGFRQPLV
jgi:hypothetical protein